ncbi:nucleoside triphosphate pyrophosphohydrolase [Pseudoalteromonas sp. OOF1S-7]|uniref:nucleoside triphosphate pyrophosphohydrolase n=1 Tax=Pseudoalteromonas sp. OOF1S-7 TaxID=2917757 RepID=UPI001EF55C96|nr:nucleoside triphosphate pyrophosphohydrolase [Pseudoalteromonas sp. OOF1S-7]MCG7537817.1 nucleoside triphosphate pyrophosphohydrolase [Pseudoalteromonas sp. OOF1S-7]
MSAPLQQLLEIMATLRDPQKGCAWDQQQTFETIVPHTLEEAYEVADSIEQQDFVGLKDELSDLLFQVIFYAQLGKEAGLFEFDDIVTGLNDKLVRRHPHVFDTPNSTLSDAELNAQWQAIKDQERAATPARFGDDVPLNLPALSRAAKIQKRAAALGFDWPTYQGALDKVAEEVTEVSEALSSDPHSEHSAEELGDLLFATVNVARHIKRDPEQLLRRASDKFIARFSAIEGILAEREIALPDASLAQMDDAWEEIKRRQRSGENN